MDSDRRALAALLVVPILSAATVIVAYVQTRQQPALAGGFYFAVGEAVLGSLPRYAETVPYYTHGGVRQGMPPFGALIAAAVASVLSPLTTAFLLPAVYHLIATVTASYLGWTYVQGDAVRKAFMGALVGGILGSSPSAYYWHLTAGGTVRGLGYLLFLLTAILTIHVFRDGRHSRVPLLGILVGLAISTHPFYGVYACSVVLLGWLAFAPTVRDFQHGFVTAIIATVISFLWLVPSVLNHGLDMYLTVGGTREGILQFTWRPITRLLTESFRESTRPFWVYLGFGGLFVAAIQDRRFLLGFTALTIYIIPRPRFMALALVLLAGVLLLAIAAASIRRATATREDIPLNARHVIVFGLAAGLVVWTMATGVGFVRADGGYPPSFVDASDKDVATWAAENTAPNATFIVTDDFAEWFPVLADRPSLVNAQGAEWDPPGTRTQELDERAHLIGCDSATCISAVVDAQPTATDYVVVPRNRVVYGSTVSDPPSGLHKSLSRSDKYTEVYRNDGNVVYAVDRGNDSG